MDTRNRQDDQPSSRGPDRQQGSPSGAHHPSDLRRREHQAQPDDVHHHAAPESREDLARRVDREHQERLAHHHGGHADEHAKSGGDDGRPFAGKR